MIRERIFAQQCTAVEQQFTSVDSQQSGVNWTDSNILPNTFQYMVVFTEKNMDKGGWMETLSFP